MASKRSSFRPSAKNPPASAFNMSARTKSNESSILLSCFCPAPFELHLFASVIQGINAQIVRFHDTRTEQLLCEHTTTGSSITCLDWGVCAGRKGKQADDPPAKRRRTQTADQDVVVALGTSDSTVQIFSPTTSEVVKTLQGGLSNGVQDFRFVGYGKGPLAWSLDGSGRIAQWNVERGAIISSLQSTDPDVRSIVPQPFGVISASRTAYFVDQTQKSVFATFSGATDQLNGIMTKTSHGGDVPEQFLASSENSLFINVFDTSTLQIKGSLVAGNDVKSLALPETTFPNRRVTPRSSSVLAAILKSGEVELFESPFDFPTAVGGEDAPLKSKRKNQTKKRTSSIKAMQSGKGGTCPIIACAFDADELVIAYAEKGIRVGFETMRWNDGESQNITLPEVHVINTSKGPAGMFDATFKGARHLGETRLNDSSTVVKQGGELDQDSDSADEQDSGDEESDEERQDSEDDKESGRKEVVSDIQKTASLNGISKDDMNIDNMIPDHGEAIGDAADVDEEPSFGERLRAMAPEGEIDVASALPDESRKALTKIGERGLELPSGLTLGTVLTQALQSNDTEFLEKCLHVREPNTIRATIERLESRHAATLLLRLAERLHRKPGRAGSLLIWVQWALVAHGGYLGAQPNLVRQLSSLHQVVKERARSLQPLLALKGKLDMLEAQMNLRRSMQTRSSRNADSDDEEDVIYVEGQESSESEADEYVNKAIALEAPIDIVDDMAINGSEDEGDEIPDAVEADELDEDSDSERQSLIDDEASVSEDEDEEDDEDEVDHDDVHSDVEEESDDEAPPSKKSRLTNGIVNQRR